MSTTGEPPTTVELLHRAAPEPPSRDRAPARGPVLPWLPRACSIRAKQVTGTLHTLGSHGETVMATGIVIICGIIVVLIAYVVEQKYKP